MALLTVHGVSVDFGGVRALDGVDLEVGGSTVTGLIGPNGAGKTTMFNVICGLQDPTSGRVALDGADITRRRPYERARLGIGRTYQRLEVFGSLSAYENAFVAAEIHQSWNRGAPDPAQVAAQVLERVGLWDVADERADALPTGLARLVELARALAAQPRVLLLDEPSSGLDETESEALGRLLGQLAGDGLGVLLVEHDVDLVMSVCSRIFVLDFGRILAAGAPEEIQDSTAVREAYLGGAGGR